MAKPCIKVLLVDDHKVVCLGLKALFETAAHFAVVGEARTAAEAIAQARRCRPDVILMDVRLSDGNGIEVCREIRSERPETRVIMLTSYSDEDAVLASITAGASGYLLKDSDAEQLIEAVKIVARGGSLLDPYVTQTVFERLRRVAMQPDDDPLRDLSEQERKMLPLVAQGKTNREIAGALCLSEHTVKTYISNILRKLNLSRRAEAAAFIATHGRLAATLRARSPVRK
jgi:two-component system response regulator DevR